MIDDLIARACTISVIDELARRSVKLQRVGQEFIGPCPVCGGRDRFAVTPKKGLWNCRRCPAGGDVIDLVRHLDGVDFATAVAMLAGDRPPAPQRSSVGVGSRTIATPAEGLRAIAMRLWEQAIPIAGTLAEQYLMLTRGLVLPSDISPRVLRFHTACPFGDRTRHPCLLALYRDIITDAPVAIMRTALTVDACKIGRMALGPVANAAIKIAANEDVTMGLTIGEGLETSLAGMMLGFLPAWALGSVGAIAHFPVLAGIDALTILAEVSDGGASARATEECWRRWHAASRDVYRVLPLCGGDVADALSATA